MGVLWNTPQPSSHSSLLRFSTSPTPLDSAHHTTYQQRILAQTSTQQPRDHCPCNQRLLLRHPLCWPVQRCSLLNLLAHPALLPSCHGSTMPHAYRPTPPSIPSTASARTTNSPHNTRRWSASHSGTSAFLSNPLAQLVHSLRLLSSTCTFHPLVLAHM